MSQGSHFAGYTNQSDFENPVGYGVLAASSKL